MLWRKTVKYRTKWQHHLATTGVEKKIEKKGDGSVTQVLPKLPHTHQAHQEYEKKRHYDAE